MMHASADLRERWILLAPSALVHEHGVRRDGKVCMASGVSVGRASPASNNATCAGIEVPTVGNAPKDQLNGCKTCLIGQRLENGPQPEMPMSTGKRRLRIFAKCAENLSLY